MATSVSEWYSGRSVFITGGTGFIGKVLLEKLLRTCPEIHAVYLLCRPKRGLSPSARVLEFFKLPLFEKIRSECPEVMKKVIAVEGDLTKEDLGIVEDVRRRLESEVSVLINSGASVRLEADLKTAVDHNTTGTLRVLNLATKMIKLEVTFSKS
ncbi:hypothetical protein AAG570_009698 [Ranatra chinensis]|uniref:Fatty acyl-CoA reductase n=1 Tax=Ranatra chinensis TaxID=642074 RepID=A0ABD0YPU5_9HEMI